MALKPKGSKTSLQQHERVKIPSGPLARGRPQLLILWESPEGISFFEAMFLLVLQLRRVTAEVGLGFI